MSNRPCPACQANDWHRKTEWLVECPNCHLGVSALQDPLHNGNDLAGWDAQAERAMEPLRHASAQKALKAIGEHHPLPGARLLDVGCAAGWFVDAARQAGCDAEGIEPDGEIAQKAKQAGLPVTPGFYPDDVGGERTFDIICFNDVFEHLTDPAAVLRAIDQHLAPHGLLVLALPNSSGPLYRIARMLLRVGVNGPFDRLWQKGFESPHLYYFNAANLDRLLARHDFAPAAGYRLPTYTMGGLWPRLRENDTANPATAAALYVLLAAASPVINGLLPPDSLLRLYRKHQTITG